MMKAEYSAAARAVKARGEVKVLVQIDKSGRVISAKAVGGHAMLRGSAVCGYTKGTISAG